MIENFDILSDFYSDPQIALYFKEEKEYLTSSQMWALLLYCHPKSKFFALDEQTRSFLIRKDFLEDESFSFADHKAVIEKLINSPLVTSKPERLLSNWERKLEERDAFLASQPYNQETYDMLDKMMKETHRMWQNYRAIYDDFLKSEEFKTQGSIVESLSEQGII